MIRAQRVIPAVLTQVIRKAPLTPEKVAFVWHSTVGAAIRRSTSVQFDHEGVLRVQAADAQWAREIKRSSAIILRRMEPMLGPGAVKRIEVSHGANRTGEVGRNPGASSGSRRVRR